MNAIKTEELPTHAEAVNAFDSCLKNFQDSLPIKEEELTLSFLGIHNSLQVRDYVMGSLGLTLSTSDSLTFLHLFQVVGSSAHVEAMTASYVYELGDKETAFEFLSNAYKLDPKNSLVALLGRCFRAGLPASTFASLREELHPKVVAGLKALEAVKVGE
jgi:hypothetical protein